MKLTKKERCKNLVVEIIKDIDNSREEAALEDILIETIPDLPLYDSVRSFAEYIAANYEYNFATARNAINELLKKGIIFQADDNYYSLSTSKHTHNVTNNIASQMYATVLPVEQAMYIEVPNNMAFIMVNELNRFLHRNDKRFYAIADNLLLLLDLSIPSESDIVEKNFDIFKFFSKHGIPIKSYNLTQKSIKGYNEETFLGMQAESDYKEHLTEVSPDYTGKLNSPRKVSPKIKLNND